MSKEILEDIINDFSFEKFNTFFREKSTYYKDIDEDLKNYDKDIFVNTRRIGYMDFGGRLKDTAIIGIQTDKDLTERSSKKAQYDFAKNLLKQEDKYEAGIFIFYDSVGNFRFSLIYPQYQGARRIWSNFRRFTYFVGQELTNKTFKQRIGEGDFSGLEKIKDVFSVEKVTKEFYESIANWYFWAVEYCQFPKDAEAEQNGRNIAVIRLITRMIFIWFMRERGLVPKDLFEEKNITSIIKSISVQDSTYYTAILQNLFFATLSTKKDERQFGSEVRGFKGYNPDFGNQYVFRYQELFKNPDDIKKYFSNVPFLNGGLFECLDDKRSGIIIDGFSRTKKNQPTVPNFLFFSQEKKVDLNKAYGTQNKKYHVHGLLNILSSFNFTIDENSPDDSDIALDPELLGRVFENLLASFNPETSTTARKATGSYYTPREIVNYMVAESLKAYFKTHLDGIENIDEKLENLFSAVSEQNPFNQEQSKKLVELIESVKIVDPAVGSGAFPMGALNKLVFILNKIDPGNELWKQAQLNAVDAIPDPNIKIKTKQEIEKYFASKKPDYWRKLYLIQRCIYGVDIQQIAVEITKLRFFISLLVDEDKNDIQPLPNLDFKIMQGNSLLEEYEGIKLFDEKLLSRASKLEIIDKISGIDLQLKENDSRRLKFYEKNPHWMKKRNMEKPAELLTLENNNKVLNSEKVALHNSLKNFEKTSLQTKLGFDGQLSSQSLGEELKRLHKEFFETSEKKEKDKLREQIEKMEWDLIEATIKEQKKEAELKKLEKFKKSKSKPFFLWQLNFAEVFEKGGFDIVIANPPYIDSEGMVNAGHSDIREAIQKNYIFTKGNWDIYIAFIESAFKKINNLGVLTFITPDKWISKPFGNELRKNTIKNIYLIVMAGREIFECSKVDSIISFFSKRQSQKIKILEFKDKTFIEKREIDKKILMEPFALDWLFSDYIELLMKIDLIPTKALSLGDCENACATSDAYKLESLIKNSDEFDKKSQLKIINTGTIGKYYSKWSKKEMTYLGHKYLKPIIEKKEFFRLFKNSYSKKSIRPKIILKGLNLLDGCLDIYGDTIPGKSTLIITGENINELKLLLAVINSKLAYFYLKEKFVASSYNQGISFTKEMINNLPVPKIVEKDQKPFIEIVDKILAITKSSDYLENPAKKEEVKEYEKQIDQLVYELYDLKDDEIKIIEDSGKK